MQYDTDGIGARLKRIRGALGHSQREFAAALGIPLPSYKDYEGDHRVPGGEALKSFGRWGVDLNWLLVGSGDVLQHGRAPGLREDPAVYGADEAERERRLSATAQRLRLALEAVEDVLHELDRTLSPAGKAELVAALYDLHTGSAVPSRAAVKRLVQRFQ